MRGGGYRLPLHSGVFPRKELELADENLEPLSWSHSRVSPCEHLVLVVGSVTSPGLVVTSLVTNHVPLPSGCARQSR